MGKNVLMLIYSEFQKVQLMPGVNLLPERYAEIKHIDPWYVCGCTFNVMSWIIHPSHICFTVCSKLEVLPNLYTEYNNLIKRAAIFSC